MSGAALGGTVDEPFPRFFWIAMKRLLIALAGLVAVVSAEAGTAPYIPANDAQVLERARIPRNDPRARELKTLRARLLREPGNLELALQLAQRYVAATRSTSDPRYLGYAEAALLPWSKLAQPPTEVLIMRATLRQSRHDFAGALADLDAALAMDPRNAQAWLTRATILTVQARYRDAIQSCTRLAATSGELVTATCLAQVGSLAGQATDAYRALATVLARHPQIQPAERAWIDTLLGEMAERLGLPAEAEAHFKQALAIDPDAYLKAAYADFLLDRGRAQEVIALLSGETAADGLLLRLALAEQAAGDSRAVEHVLMLRQRFDAARLRGDTVHQREESRFVLQLEHAPPQALALAEADWAVQREPADARILLEAAQAASDKAAAAPVLAWLYDNRVEDARLRPLAANMTAMAARADRPAAKP
jgi:tetratricopeptide (TPR) repeat protein